MKNKLRIILAAIAAIALIATIAWLSIPVKLDLPVTVDNAAMTAIFLRNEGGTPKSDSVNLDFEADDPALQELREILSRPAYHHVLYRPNPIDLKGYNASISIGMVSRDEFFTVHIAARYVTCGDQRLCLSKQDALALLDDLTEFVEKYAGAEISE